MFASEGFWGAVSTLIMWSAIIFGVYMFRKEIRSILERLNKIKVIGNEVALSRTTETLGDYTTELQLRVARIEEKINVNDTKNDINVDSKNYFEDNNKILWVDDFPSNNEFIVERLRKLGLQVDLSISTEDAIARFTAFDHKLIISDLGRIEHGVDNPLAGIDLVKAIRRINQIVPILIFAGQRGLGLKDKILEAGASQVTISGVEVMKFIERNL
jgi:CheY-like chemotaxis protein